MVEYTVTSLDHFLSLLQVYSEVDFFRGQSSKESSHIPSIGRFIPLARKPYSYSLKRLFSWSSKGSNRRLRVLLISFVLDLLGLDHAKISQVVRPWRWESEWGKSNVRDSLLR